MKETDRRKIKTEECARCTNSCDDCFLDDILFMGNMPAKEKRTLIRSSEQKHLRKGSYLFHEGEPVNALYIILKGRIKLVRYDAEGREHIVGIFVAGETIWEEVIPEQSIFPYSGVCLTSSDFCIIQRKDFIRVLKDPDIAYDIIRLLSVKLHDANERNLFLSMREPKAKVAAFLIYRQKRDHEDVTVLKLEDIAASLGLRAETVSRKIQELIREGYIERTAKSSIRIVDFDGLEGLI